MIAKFVKGGQSSGGLKLPQSQPNIIVGPACMMPAEVNATGRAYNAYNQVTGPVDVAPVVPYNRDTNGFGFNGRDPSQVGGIDPSLRPSGS